MSKKISVRLPDRVYEELCSECLSYGFRGISSYIITLLERRKVVEIEGGTELATAISKLMQTRSDSDEFRKAREDVCRCFAMLMTEIEALKNCQES